MSKKVENSKEEQNAEIFERTKMQRDMIISRLKQDGCRITKQRKMLLDIILQEDCSCCKEIYYKACKKDPNIGTATVYRMISTLEDIGAINKKNMYKIQCEESCAWEKECKVEWEDNSEFFLSKEQLKDVIAAGLKACGYDTRGCEMKNVVFQ